MRLMIGGVEGEGGARPHTTTNRRAPHPKNRTAQRTEPGCTQPPVRHNGTRAQRRAGRVQPAQPAPGAAGTQGPAGAQSGCRLSRYSMAAQSSASECIPPSAARCRRPASAKQRGASVWDGGARSPLTAALPSGGAAEHRGELRGHVRGVAEVEAGRRVACGGRLLIRASGEVRAGEPKTRAREGDRAAPAPSEHSSVGGACCVGSAEVAPHSRHSRADAAAAVSCSSA